VRSGRFTESGLQWAQLPDNGIRTISALGMRGFATLSGHDVGAPAEASSSEVSLSLEDAIFIPMPRPLEAERAAPDSELHVRRVQPSGSNRATRCIAA